MKIQLPVHDFARRQGEKQDVQELLDKNAADGWEPIQMSTATTGSAHIKIVILLEKRGPH